MSIHWPLVLFTLLTGLGVGAFSCVAVTEWLNIGEVVRIPGTITSLIAMAAGGIAGGFHLSHPFRTYNIVKHLKTGIGKEMLLISITGSAIFIYAVLLFTGGADIARKILSLVGLASGVILAFEMGATYVLPGRPAWKTLLWPVVYASSAAVTGLFAIYIWAAVFKNRAGEAFILGMNTSVLIVLFVQVGVVIAYLIFLESAPAEDPIRKPARLFCGDGAIPFWSGVVFAGLVIPITLTLWVQAARSVQLTLIVAVIGWVGVLLGGVAIRALMYTLGDEMDPIL